MFYIETGSTDPCYNLAFEEYLLKNRTYGDWLMLWQNANTVVVGMNQNTAEEVNAAFVESHGVRVVRRITGGGAVYHDLGNLNYSFITDADDAGHSSMGRFTGAVCGALRTLGVAAEAGGRNDITVQGKKVSGAAQRLYKGRILHHGTLLFRSDPEMISGALRVNPAKYRSRGIQSVRSRVGNICDFLPAGTTVEECKHVMLRLMTEADFSQVRLDAWETAEIRRLADGKYRTWQWTYGASPPYSAVKKAERLDGGILELYMEIGEGYLESLAFRGDFMSLLSPAPLAAAFRGCRFTREEAAAVLRRFPIAAMFGAISAEEILELMFS